MIGTWVLYIPQVKQKLQLDDAQIGFALFCLALGLLFFIPTAPLLSKKIGLGKCTFFGICLFSLAYVGPLLANSYNILCISLFVVGAFSGLTDVAMNAVVSQMEQEDDVNFMSSAHGFFSLGGFIGAVIGSFLLGVFSLAYQHMLIMALLVVVSNLLLARYYFGYTENQVSETKEKTSFKQLKPLFFLGFLGLVIMGNEGAIEHWSSIYFTDVVNVTKKNLAGLGFTIFSIMMTIGRFFGDGISEKIGSVKIIILGTIFGALGYGFILTEALVFSIIGFGIIGLGLSVIVPELFRVAGQTKGISATKSISFVSASGFFGFLLGPIVLGYISDSYGLKMSFTTLLILMVIATLFSLIKLKQKRET